MSVIAWIILGFATGVVANKLAPGRGTLGLVSSALVGISGALFGGFLAVELFEADSMRGFFEISTWITAIAGAAVLLYANHLITGQGTGRGFGDRADRRKAGRK